MQPFRLSLFITLLLAAGSHLPGARYIIQSSPDLVTWTNLLTSVDATNRLTTFTLTNAASLSRRFFRLGVDTGP